MFTLSSGRHGPLILYTDRGTCSQCNIREDLWLCLDCGHLGCGRRQAGAVGEGHALRHHECTRSHRVVVKFHTATAEGTADVFCYACDQDSVNPYLEAHFKYLGIDITECRKTERSMKELQDPFFF